MIDMEVMKGCFTFNVNCCGSNSGEAIVPSIGENGNWWIGEKDTGVSAQGPKGDTGEAGSGGNRYLTEETICGTWIDGKPIYRKVLELTTPKAGMSVPLVNVAELNISRLVDLYGTVNNGNEIPINVYYSSSDYFVCWYHVLEKNILCHLINAYSNKELSLILEYTKK